MEFFCFTAEKFLLLAQTANALAGPLTIINLGCGTKPPPCIKFLDTDGEIMPSDWYRREYRELGGRLNYFRVEVKQVGDPFRMSLGDYALDERFYSTRESNAYVDVYYVPASPEALFRVYTDSREPGAFDVTITGAAEAGY